jgi:Tfp pilus assembly protein PilW
MKFKEIINRINSKKALSLVEILLYLAVLSVLITTISAFLYIVLSGRIKSQTVSEVEEQGVQVMNIITQTIRNSEGVNIPVAKSSSNSLSLEVDSPPDNPTVFSVKSGILEIAEGGGQSIELTNSKVTITNLTFYNLARNSNRPDSIKVEFTLEYNNPEGRNEYDYSKTFYGTADVRQ